MRKTRTRTKSASEGSESGRRLMNANNLRRRVDLSGLSRKERELFYAGAKFDTVPENNVIPVPPTKWIMQEGTRSQSSPSSPITVSGKPTTVVPSPSVPIKLDIESLFGTKRHESSHFIDSRLGRLLMSASVPESRMMTEMSRCHRSERTLDVTTNSYAVSSKRIRSPSPVIWGTSLEPMVVDQQRSLLQTPVHPVAIVKTNTAELLNKVSGISGKDLMGLLKPEPQRQVIDQELQRPKSVNKLMSPSCQFEFDHPDPVDSQYKDITNHLKSILKVSITAA